MSPSAVRNAIGLGMTLSSAAFSTLQCKLKPAVLPREGNSLDDA